MPVHIKHSTTRAEATPTEWLGVGRSIGELVNACALRHDVIAYVGPGAGQGSAACYNPVLAEVEVDVEQAFGKGVTPEQVGDLSDRSRQYEFPRATGAILHEAFHARFSLWDFARASADLDEDELAALMLLEETRIEASGIRAMPDALLFLRASALEIAIGDAEEKFAEGSDVRGAMMLVALVHGRVEAGVLDRAEVGTLLDLVDAVLGADVTERLVDILRRAQAHDRHADAVPLYDLAREWVAVGRKAMEDAGEDPDAHRRGAAMMIAGAGEEGEEGEGGPASSAFARRVLEALADAADDVAIANHGALVDQQEGEDWKREAKHRAKDAKRRQEAKNVADEVFGGSSTAEVGASPTHADIRETRMPRPAERSAAVVIAEMLERARYRDRDATEVVSAIPPGRLRTRALVQGAALRSRGVVAAVEPWRRTVRRMVDDPTITVGVMVDISGSMHSAMEPMATTAWVMSEAARRVQGRCAMVYFGNDVFPTLRVGQHLPEVTVYQARDNTEKFHKAFTALDGELNLLDGTGARLLVVVSDAHYTGEETRRATEAVRACADAGVAVLWLPFRNDAQALMVSGGLAEVVGTPLGPEDAAGEIGRAAAKALERAGATR